MGSLILSHTQKRNNQHSQHNINALLKIWDKTNISCKNIPLNISVNVIGQLGQFNHVTTILINAHHGGSFADCALLVAHHCGSVLCLHIQR